MAVWLLALMLLPPLHKRCRMELQTCAWPFFFAGPRNTTPPLSRRPPHQAILIAVCWPYWVHASCMDASKRGYGVGNRYGACTRRPSLFPFSLSLFLSSSVLWPRWLARCSGAVLGLPMRSRSTTVSETSVGLLPFFPQPGPSAAIHTCTHTLYVVHVHRYTWPWVGHRTDPTGRRHTYGGGSGGGQSASQPSPAQPSSLPSPDCG